MEAGIDFTSLAVNLGIAGTVIVLVILGMYRIAIRLIANWRETERERTQAIMAGFAGVVSRIEDVSDLVSRFDGKLDGSRPPTNPGTRSPP